MRALIISNYLEEPGTRDKYRAVAALGVNLLVATPGGSATTEASVRYAPVAVRGSPEEPATRRWHLPTLRRLFSEHRPELLHLEADPDSHLTGDAAALAQKARCPYVVFSWRSLPAPLGLLARRRARAVLRNAGGVIGGNHLAMNLLREEAPAALATAIPLAGVPFPELRPPTPTDAITLAFAGRLVPERGADLLIRALGQTFGKWRLMIAGTGPEQVALEATIQRLGLASRIRWLGGLRREALDEVFREADVLVVPSRDTAEWVEYHSPVLLEAMSHGIAPLVTRSGCLPSLVGEAGVVVEGIEQLTEVLQAWVADPSAARVIGGQARQRVLDRYVTGAVAGQTVAFWRATLDHPPTGPT